MKTADSYRLARYQDFGPLGKAEHIRLVRNSENGKICVKKILHHQTKDIIEFRKNTMSVYFPQLYEAVCGEEQYVIIEEYIEGVTLEEYMMSEPLEEDLAVKFAGQICEALHCLHTHHPMIVYRDLKPENIIITNDECIRLIDFDIARKYEEGKKRDTELLGTAAYAAPEQFGYFQTDQRTDIYSFGVLFNYMITGKFPVEYITEGQFASMIRKCIAMEPDSRYQSVEEILRELPHNREKRKKPNDQEQKEKTFSDTDRTSWALPGFRSGKIGKILLGAVVYFCIVYVWLTLDFHDIDGNPYPPLRQWINKTSFAAGQLMAVLFVGNYRGISGRLSKFYHHRKITIRWVCRMLTWLFFLFVAALVTAALEMILKL